MSTANPFLLTIWLSIAIVAGVSVELGAQQRGDNPPLALKGRERILFLGGSLFENELEHGYLEFALTSRWPDLDLTFRNLGWTGDNVFAEARSTFTTPPTPYQQLFQQIRSTKPSIVLIAYGGVESQQGQGGIARFVNGLEAIIDSVDRLGAQTILLSTIPLKRAGTVERTLAQNTELKRYAAAIAEVAAKRKKRYVDLYSPIDQSKDDLFLGNGIHLSAAGYRYLASALEQALGWPSRYPESTVAVSKATATGSGPVKIVSSKADGMVFSLDNPLLPLPPEKLAKKNGIAGPPLRITGLDKGNYTLTGAGGQILTATAAEWASGIVIDGDDLQRRATALCGLIVKKNALFFQQYRPMNRTYILGFRAYEQGRHKQGLDDMDALISSLEDQIKQLRKLDVKTYELTRTGN